MIARIYVAGPYTNGEVAINVRNAYEAANQLAELGFAPFVPHATAATRSSSSRGFDSAQRNVGLSLVQGDSKWFNV